MALLRPSLTLVLDLDERLAGKDTVLEIKRCYTYVCTPVIRHHGPESDDAPMRNDARMIVGLGTRKYLHSADEGADALWDDVVGHWIGNMLHKIGSTMRAFNARQRRIDLPEVVFDRIDVELQGGEFVVSLHTDPQSFIDSDASEQVDRARMLLNVGVLKGASRVLVPSDESYTRQRDAAFAQWQIDHPEPEVVSDAGQEPIEEEEACEPLTREEWLELDKQAKSYENTAVPPTDSNTLPPIQREEEPPEPERFSFEVDCGEWGVVMSDGSVRTFDPAAQAFSD